MGDRASLFEQQSYNSFFSENGPSEMGGSSILFAPTMRPAVLFQNHNRPLNQREKNNVQRAIDILKQSPNPDTRAAGNHLQAMLNSGRINVNTDFGRLGDEGSQETGTQAMTSGGGGEISVAPILVDPTITDTLMVKTSALEMIHDIICLAATLRHENVHTRQRFLDKVLFPDGKEIPAYSAQWVFLSQMIFALQQHGWPGLSQADVNELIKKLRDHLKDIGGRYDEVVGH